MWEPRKRTRELAHGARLSPLSGEDTAGAVFNSQLDRRRAAGGDVLGSHVAVSLFSATFVCRRRLTSTVGPPVLERAGHAGGVGVGGGGRYTSSIRCPPACSAVSRCDACSLISSWAMTCLALQRRHFCSLSVTSSNSRGSFIFMCGRIKPVSGGEAEEDPLLLFVAFLI